ncbi:MAG TPA: nuclear transport factor 2 family protein [Pyrinomonadaceae bacterium]|nr:nuclear transport factor 2 family protein [Pyrinomonadaceae bacterium]
MRRILSSVFLLLFSSASVCAQAQAPDAAALKGLLNEFLAGAGRNDAAIHERFWAEDLIYTGSSGRRVGKADIMRDVRSAPEPKPGDPRTVYTAEDVRVQQYGDTAVVAFRLVGTTMRGGAAEVSKFLNTGTLLRRGGRWQAVSWQATRLPRDEEEVRREVAAAEAAFHQAMLAGDVKRLEALLDETFVRMFRDGSRQTRREALEELGSGRLKFSRLETSGVTVNVYGDAAVVRGKSLRQRTAVPGAEADAAPFEFFYTMTFVNRGGAWKAVAMHSSHP